jgi:hypothetical protein
VRGSETPHSRNPTLTLPSPLRRERRINATTTCASKKWRLSSRPGKLGICGNTQRQLASNMIRWRSLRLVFVAGLASSFLALNHVQSATAPEPGDLRAAGKVQFPVSCAPAVQPEFARGVALLHSFFYEEARRVFTSVAERDPKCAMAQWGIAMTWWHPIWTPPTPDEMRAGKAAIKRAMAIADSSPH